jgi:Ca2+-binding EF-hand superfamily protein
LAKADTNGDGMIEFDEFYEVMQAFMGSNEQIQFFWRKLLNGANLDAKVYFLYFKFQRLTQKSF